MLKTIALTVAMDRREFVHGRGFAPRSCDTTAKRLAAVACAMVAVALIAPQASAQAYPAKAIRIVVPFPPAGATDVVTRVLADRLGQRLGQSVVVDNKPGAGGAIGSDFVAKSTADGYTLLLSTSSTHSIGPVLNPKTPYNVERDFAPIVHVANSTNVLLVGANVPVNSVKELVALAKAQRGRVNYGSSGVGTVVHLMGEMFARMADIEVVHVPYKGTALAMPDLMTGQLTYLFDAYAAAAPHVKSGKAKVLATTGGARSPHLPDVPTVAEAGLSDYTAIVYFGIFAPAGTAPAVTRLLSAETAIVLKQPEVIERFTNLGLEPVGGGPDQLGTIVRSETAKWTKVIRDAGIRLE